MLLLIVTLAIPPIIFDGARRVHPLLKFFVGTVFACAILTGSMIITESQSPNSDIDIVFEIGVIFWNVALVVFYGIYFGVLSALETFLKA